MTIRTVQISEHVSAQGEFIEMEAKMVPAFDVVTDFGVARFPEVEVETHRATVSTGPTTTATGRIIERKRDA